MFVHYCSAQIIPGIKDLKPAQLLALGKNAIKLGDSYSAIEYYKRYLLLNQKDKEAAWQLAELYRAARDYSNAQDWYLKVYESDKTTYVTGLFWYATMLKQHEHYDDAQKFYKQFKKEYKGSDQQIKNRLKIEMNGCALAKDIVDKDNADLMVRVKHLNESINQPHVELSPMYLDDENMVYSALKLDSIPLIKLTDRLPVRKFYKAFKDEGDWYNMGEFAGPFNKADAQTGNGALSPDGSRFYFTRCASEPGKKSRCEIYVSKKENGNWAEPIRLDINSATHTNTHPAVGKASKGKEVLYFSSNREGGRGASDIWYSVYDPKKDVYTDVKNAGSKVNTEFDEFTPFVHAETNALYFSSDGWAGLGGLDIFRTTGSEGRWLSPVNMGYPLNSGADDLYYTSSQAKDKEGFFVSNRKAGNSLRSETCCDDIYSFVKKGSLHVDIHAKLYDVDYVEKILEMEDARDIDNNRLLIANQPVQVFEVAGTGEDKILVQELTTDAKGEFKFEAERNKRYEVVVHRKGYFAKHHEFVTKGVDGEVLQQHLGLLILTKDPIIVKNVYYPYNESYMTDEAKETIDTSLYKILVQNPSIIVEISSHTDSHGADEYNLKLSQRRAESVVNYLIELGIEKNRLSPKGYGEKSPISKNENPDGSDNPEGRALNRRTEFRVTGTLDKDTEIIYRK